MPGFIVNGLGEGVPSTVKPYYKYTWEVEQIYGNYIGDRPSADVLPLIYCVDATLPSWDFDKEEIQGASLIYKFAKSIKWNEVKITFYDTLGLASIIKQWRENIWTPEGGLSGSDDYKRQSILSSTTFDWDSDNDVTWQLINSWPGSVKSGDLSYTNSEIKTVDVTLIYDWAVDTTP